MLCNHLKCSSFKQDFILAHHQNIVIIFLLIKLQNPSVCSYSLCSTRSGTERLYVLLNGFNSQERSSGHRPRRFWYITKTHICLQFGCCQHELMSIIAMGSLFTIKSTTNDTHTHIHIHLLLYSCKEFCLRLHHFFFLNPSFSLALSIYLVQITWLLQYASVDWNANSAPTTHTIVYLDNFWRCLFLCVYKLTFCDIINTHINVRHTPCRHTFFSCVVCALILGNTMTLCRYICETNGAQYGHKCENNKFMKFRAKMKRCEFRVPLL